MDKSVNPQEVDSIQNVPRKPLLEKKHSSGDLQSRLKTRKILGVGETDNGDIHRSKISQVLGHNEHLYVRFPRCYAVWYFSMAIICTGCGLNLLLPNMNQQSTLQEQNASPLDSPDVTEKLYGSILLGFSSLLWSLWGTTDKTMARSLMLAMAIGQTLQFGTMCNYSFKLEAWSEKLKWQMAIHFILAVGNVYYFWAIGSSTAGLRKSGSYKDLKELQQQSEGSNVCPECRSDLKQKSQSKKEE